MQYIWADLILLALAGGLDYLSTTIGQNIGLSERNPLFLHFPWISTLLLMCLVSIIPLFPYVPEIFKIALTQGLIVLSFAPAILNTFLILAVIL
jgi:hypothetical protein